MHRLFLLFVVAATPLVLASAGCGSSEAAPSPQPTVAPSEPASVVTPEVPVRADSLPDGFVYLRDVAPTILQEMRYTTAFNFVGEPIDGYEAATCILTERAAHALAAVQDGLEDDGLSLKVYDCYRPQTAVNHFVRWARSSDETMKQAFYPEEPKSLLFQRGYIARRSGHSGGSTVDLTLVALPHPGANPYPDPQHGALPQCDRPLVGPTGPDIQGGGRFPEGDLDMGTAYDCLSPASATESRAVSEAARRNRYRLRTAMSQQGFRNYSKEWWHFTLRNEPFAQTYFDFPVR